MLRNDDWLMDDYREYEDDGYHSPYHEMYSAEADEYDRFEDEYRLELR